MTKPLVMVRSLKKYFPHQSQSIKAVNDISFDIFPGETLGLVGESGCGKSTIGKCIIKLEEASSGEIHFDGLAIQNLRGKSLRAFRRQTGVIFQDPYASLNPRMTAGDIITEPLKVHKLGNRQARLKTLLNLVGLPLSSIGRFPHEFSGGQRQRIGIARALAAEPRFILCDEPISSLDVSVQAQIINLLKNLQEEMGLTYLFIAHDLRIVRYLSTRVAVMYLGHIVEIAPTQTLYKEPQHPYTQALLSAIPIPDPEAEKKRRRVILQGEVPSPLDPPKGCPFSTRCPVATPLCYHVTPKLQQIGEGHFAACHLLKNEPKHEEVVQGAGLTKYQCTPTHDTVKDVESGL
ncbi:MAG: Oligopeptide transport ATP-binding protein OppF [Chlamydiae bacterium]|nr:Oligopeptide transport ATP-binding protein OppF [Chlamydiota bacterium]